MESGSCDRGHVWDLGIIMWVWPCDIVILAHRQVVALVSTASTNERRASELDEFSQNGRYKCRSHESASASLLVDSLEPHQHLTLRSSALARHTSCRYRLTSLIIQAVAKNRHTMIASKP